MAFRTLLLGGEGSLAKFWRVLAFNGTFRLLFKDHEVVMVVSIEAIRLVANLFLFKRGLVLAVVAQELVHIDVEVSKLHI